MTDISPERVLYARIFLAQFYQFKQLERVNTDEVGWMMLKFSCSRREAEQLVEAVEQDEAERQQEQQRVFRPLVENLLSPLAPKRKDDAL